MIICFAREKTRGYPKKWWPRSWGSAGRQFPNGKRTKPCRISGQSKNLAVLYGISLDELIDWDGDRNLQEIQEAIDRTSDETADKIDWTKAWSKKYPILLQYQEEVEVSYYAAELDKLLSDLEKKYGYDALNAMLVLKDILAAVWKSRKKKRD